MAYFGDKGVAQTEAHAGHLLGGGVLVFHAFIFGVIGAAIGEYLFDDGGTLIGGTAGAFVGIWVAFQEL